MACNINTSISKICAPSFGGVSKVWLINLADIASWASPTAGVYALPTLVTDAEVYSIAFVKNTATYGDNGGLSTASGAKYFDHTLEFTLTASSRVGVSTQVGDAVTDIDAAEFSDFIKRLHVAEGVVAIVQDALGVRRILGKQNGLESTGSQSGAGKTKDDLNGAVFTFAGTETTPALILSRTASLD